jgi:hypothetical protein
VEIWNRRKSWSFKEQAYYRILVSFFIFALV